MDSAVNEEDDGEELMTEQHVELLYGALQDILPNSVMKELHQEIEEMDRVKEIPKRKLKRMLGLALYHLD